MNISMKEMSLVTEAKEIEEQSTNIEYMDIEGIGRLANRINLFMNELQKSGMSLEEDELLEIIDIMNNASMSIDKVME